MLRTIPSRKSNIRTRISKFIDFRAERCRRREVNPFWNFFLHKSICISMFIFIIQIFREGRRSIGPHFEGGVFTCFRNDDYLGCRTNILLLERIAIESNGACLVKQISQIRHRFISLSFIIFYCLELYLTNQDTILGHKFNCVLVGTHLSDLWRLRDCKHSDDNL